MIRVMRAALLVALIGSCGFGGSRRDSAGEIGVLGPVCGSSAIIGVPREPVRSEVHRSCGIDAPVRVHEVSGVALSMQPLVNCATARALNDWVVRGAKPAVADLGARLESLRVVAHYACRTRNSQAGAKISEHGRGNAVDVAGFRLSDGTELSVLTDWGNGARGRVLSRIRSAACGPFGVVLGPGSDRFHRDHLHMDISHLNNPYCR